MTYIVRLSRICPHCMRFHKIMPLTLASPYIFRVKFNWSHDYIAMSEISSVEPLFYHPITKTYFVGAPEDPYLLSKFTAFLINYDIDTTLNKTNNLPAPNYPFLIDNMLYKLNEQVANFLREKYGGSVLKTKDSVYKTEISVLKRISNILENI